MSANDLNEFKNLSEFFRRTLKPNARTIDFDSCLASPCDGRILHFGKVENGYLEQVKGVNYSLRSFLGENNWPKLSQQRPIQTTIDSNIDKEYERNILKDPINNSLFHCVIYLAPGDYHRFHTPTDWTILSRRHFPGELFSVNPKIVKWLKGLLSLNERVVYYGEWKYGFFSMTPVGATNVGSIKVYIDDVSWNR
jgi:phosphatidylserine decarboxylase